MNQVKGLGYSSHMQAAKAKTSLRLCADSSEPSLLAHTRIVT